MGADVLYVMSSAVLSSTLLQALLCAKSCLKFFVCVLAADSRAASPSLLGLPSMEEHPHVSPFSREAEASLPQPLPLRFFPFSARFTVEPLRVVSTPAPAPAALSGHP